ncbi:hypothetical protein ACH5RR_034161 [Cinchona calisaya]|uniref:non-specific serine/threonine protein kinase n=1 Tax=Cinchona calisaya TaxID=153742 RepID=A0ABD2YAX8_9GENT
MVKTWAKKEMRNRMRLKAAGISCPTPFLLRLHVLVMEFIGKGGWAGPRLKDAVLSLDKLRECYVEGHLYIIDVSQAVDLDHPRALDFLREDCVHVSDFFKKHGVAAMTIRELFDFIVDPSIDGATKEKARGNVISAEEETADSVFMQIPKTLNHVKNAEDVQWLTSGTDTVDMYYQTITGECPGLANSELRTETDEDESYSTVTDKEDSSSEDEQPTAVDRKAARKENKKKVKEEKREARKHKVPKAVKKKKKKLVKAKKYR